MSDHEYEEGCCTAVLLRDSPEERERLGLILADKLNTVIATGELDAIITELRGER